MCLPNPETTKPGVGARHRSQSRLRHLPWAARHGLRLVAGHERSFLRTPKLVAALDHFAPDIVVARRPPYDVAFDRTLAKTGLPYVAEVNAVLEAEQRTLGTERLLPRQYGREQRYLLGAKSIVVVSESVRAQVLSLGVRTDKVRVVPNGVDTDLFTPDTQRDHECLEWARSLDYVVAYCGSFFPTTDLTTLLEATDHVVSIRPDTGFLFVGPVSQQLEAANAAVCRRLGGRLMCTGPRLHREIPGLLAVADVCWAAFKNDYGSPLKFYEYFAMAKPVVAASDGFPADELRSSGGGLCVPRGDAAGLAEALLSVLSMPPIERQALGERARRWVVANRTWDAVAARYLDFATSVVR